MKHFGDGFSLSIYVITSYIVGCGFVEEEGSMN
jgi:hypothetical protein